MRAVFSELLVEAAGRGGAVGAFTCYNLETAQGVLEAAAGRGRAVILLVSRESFAGPGGEVLLPALAAAAAHASVPACVQLDHVSDLGLIERASDLGADAVMADGSKLPLQENIDLVRAARALAGEVEAELGVIEGDEDVAAAVEAGALTDPVKAASLAGESGAACLAVSIGNVHGHYRLPPRLDWARLEQIRARVDVPLSLHGASGLADEDLGRAISLGIRKVNVNTELREAYLEATAERLGAVRDEARVLDLNRRQVAAVAEVVGRKLNVLG
jgi:ketose-bisphosphate aldolase